MVHFEESSCLEMPLTELLALAKDKPMVKDGKVRWAFIGGAALLFQAMHRGLALPRALSDDIDVITFDRAVGFSGMRNIQGYHLQEFDMDEFGWLTYSQDCMVVDICGVQIAIIKPEYMLITKMRSRPKDVADAVWLIKNIPLNQEYYEKLMKREGLDQSFRYRDLTYARIQKIKETPDKIAEFIGSSQRQQQVNQLWE